MRSAGEVMEALDAASKGVQAASTELSELVVKFYEGGEGPEGEVILGTGLQFQVKLKEEKARVFQEAIEEGRKPPPADIREAVAYKALEVNNPGLFAEYHAKKARIDGLKLWISNQKAAISANQSILKGEQS